MNWATNGHGSLYRSGPPSARQVFLRLNFADGQPHIQLTHEILGLSPNKHSLDKLELAHNWSKTYASVIMKGAFSEWPIESFFQVDSSTAAASANSFVPNSPSRRRRRVKAPSSILTVFGKKGAYSEALIVPDAPEVKVE